MISSNLKLKPLSLALLGALPFVPAYAEEATPVKVVETDLGNHRIADISIETDSSVRQEFYYYNYYTITPPKDSNGDFQDFTLDLNLNDPNFVLHSSGMNRAAFDSSSYVSNNGDKKVTINYNLNHFHSINTDSTYAKGIQIDVRGENTTNVVTNFNLNGEEERTINVKQIDTPNRGTNAGIHNYYQVQGEHYVNINAPNTYINVENKNLIAPPNNDNRFIGINLDFIDSNKADINIENINIDVKGHNNSASAVGIRLNNLDTDYNKPNSIKYLDNKLNFKGNIKVTNGAVSTGISLRSDLAYSGLQKAVIKGGKIEVAGGTRYNFGVAISQIKLIGRKPLPDYVVPEKVPDSSATIIQEAGDIIVNQRNEVDNLDNLNAQTAGIDLWLPTSANKATAVQKGGTITVLNTQENAKFRHAGIHAKAPSIDITQEAGARINVQGVNNSGIYAEVINDTGTLKLDVNGYVNATNAAITLDNKTGENRTADVTIGSTAELNATNILEVKGLGEYLINIDEGAKLGLDDKEHTIDLQANTTLSLNNVDLSQINSIRTDDNHFVTLNLNSYQNFDINSKVNPDALQRLELENGNYKIERFNGGYRAPKPTTKVAGLTVYHDANLTFADIAGTDPINYIQTPNVENYGTIDLRQEGDDQFRQVQIDGDYIGHDGTLDFNVELNGDQSKADLLTINGEVSGTTSVRVHQKGGYGAATDKGIKLIALSDEDKVKAPKAEEVFTLADKLEVGAYEYNTLHFSKEENAVGYYLQSRAHIKTAENGDSTVIINGKPVYQLRKGTAAYVLNQQINAQALANLNASLYQRSGEQRAESNYLNQNQSWVRYLGNQDELTANNLGAKTTNFGVQVGYDFRTSHNHESGLRNRTGIYAAYNKVDSTLTDSYRKEFHIPGRIDTSLGSLALYHTATLGNGYLDLVGGLHFFHSDYEIFNGGEQNAFGGNLSVEGGYNLDLGNHFFVEPQVQLSYQGTRYAGFKDAVTAVKGYTHQSLRPRAGFRLGYHDLAGTNLWLHANLETELLKTAKLTIGQDIVSINRAAKTVYDLGLNGQVALNPTTVLYGSAQYRGSFDKAQTLAPGLKVKTTKLQGFGAEAGLRFTW